MATIVNKKGFSSSMIIDFIKHNTIWTALIALFIVMSFASPVFLTGTNLTNLLTTESIKGIMTIGVMFTILSKGIDISTASVLALSACITSGLVQEGTGKLFGDAFPVMPVVVAIIVGILVGLVVGVINGALVAYTKIPPFIATLGLSLVLKGVALLITDSYPVGNLSTDFKQMGQGSMIPHVPNVVVFFIVIVVLGGFLLTQTRFGRNVYAIGGNDVAAKVAGINVALNLVMVYAFCSMCAGLGGSLLAARSGSGIASMGFNYELDAIAAATVGGTSHTGGVARISGVIAGILLLGVLNNALLIFGVSPYIQQIIKGAIIVIAVVFDMRKNAKKD